METRGQGLDRALAVLVGDGIDVADQAGADEHRALVAFGQRTRIRHAGGIDLDVEAGRHLELGKRQLVRGRRDRRRRDRGKLGGGLIVRRAARSGASPAEAARRRPAAAAGRRSGGLLRGSAECENTEKSAGQQQAARRGRADHHDVLPCGGLILARANGMPAPVAFLRRQSPIFFRRCAIGNHVAVVPGQDANRSDSMECTIPRPRLRIGLDRRTITRNDR